MIHWVNNHGIEVLILYYIFSAALSSMPPLPETAGYWSRWAYGCAHILSGNLVSFAQLLKLPIKDDKSEPPKVNAAGA